MHDREAVEDRPIGDAARGRHLLARYECHRCHEGTGLAPPPLERRCVGCHRAIEAGRFDAPDETLRRWRANLHSLPEAPDLAGARRLRPAWIASFLRDPRDLRPHLEATMPRLAIDARDARDLAAALTARPARAGAVATGETATSRGAERSRAAVSTQPEGAPAARSAASALGEGDAERGRRLLEVRPCGHCHTLAGDPLPARGDPGLEGAAFARARTLAPDLAHARDRLRPRTLVAWLRDPRAVHPDTPMPPTGLSAREAVDVARHLVDAPRPPADPEAPPLLPPLEREVRFDEVRARVLRRVCWHCHSDPSFALGDGGPGNSGGFGFAGRGLDLSSYQGVRSGARSDDGARRSVFRAFEMPGGTELPFLLAAMRARQLEEAGRPVPGLRGMPLGLPSVTAEGLQLVRTWIAQGRRR
ncbi:MAG TPA: cytochrome C oxidase Cbb3 [Sandaracinaceae bacterium LLY-WYZ-13_1]|nr:cytochrome C oxidase Cbb3 [Sandaracinaceae bacterium LLY-WYZ-13_1]